MIFGWWYIFAACVLCVVIGVIIYNNSYNDTPGVAMIACGALIGMLALMVSIGMPLSAKESVMAFNNAKAITEETIRESSTSDRYAITQTVVERNMWLAGAKANKEMYGCFSPYVYCDIDGLEYIVIPSGD